MSALFVLPILGGFERVEVVTVARPFAGPLHGPNRNGSEINRAVRCL